MASSVNPASTAPSIISPDGTHNLGTQRTDQWQLEPMITLVALILFVIYSMWRGLQNAHFEVPGTQYISPFYSPYLPHLFNAIGLHIKALETSNGLGWVISPAIFILWMPAGFRGTCYFYRRVYYRAMFASPSACAVGPKAGNPVLDACKATLGRLLGAGRKYGGEKILPMALMNLHRYFFYLALMLIVVHVIDTFAAFFMPGFAGLRVGVGTFVMVIDLVLLASYVLGCHSYRHILGGGIDCFSACPVSTARGHAWKRQGIFNMNHMQFGWLSMFWVAFADLYVMLLSKGVFNDFVFFSMKFDSFKLF